MIVLLITNIKHMLHDAEFARFLAMYALRLARPRRRHRLRAGLATGTVQSVSNTHTSPGLASARARALTDAVVLFYEHPRVLKDVLPLCGDIQPGHVWRLIHEFAANPVVENRWDDIHNLRELLFDQRVDTVSLQPSHAEAIAQLSRLLLGRVRARAWGWIIRTRYENVPFVSAQDVAAAMALGDPVRFLAMYLGVLPTQLHRLNLHWEHAALVKRGTTVDDQRKLAVEHVLALEEHARDRYPFLLHDPEHSVHAQFLSAYGAARAPPGHAERHWRWLLQYRRPLSPSCVDLGLAAARDLNELEAVWHDVRALVDLRTVEFPLAMHYARLGGFGSVHEFLGIRPSGIIIQRWIAQAQARDPVRFDEAGVSMYKRYHMLRSAGMDWDGAVFMLGPFSPYYSVTRGLLPPPPKPLQTPG